MLAGYAVTKNEWVLKSLERFRVDVINLTDQELAFLVSPAGRAAISGSRALLGRMVSSNTVSAAPDGTGIRPYVVALVPDRKGPAGGRIRVAFVGISDDQNESAGGHRVRDPIETVRRVVSKARAEADVVVVLAHASTETASRIAHEAPGVDVVIAGNGKEFTMPVTVGRVPVVFTAYETRMLGELRFYRNEDRSYTIKNRFIGLDSAIADDQQASAFVAESRQAVKSEVEKFTKPIEAG